MADGALTNEDNEKSIFEADDLVFMRKGDKIYAGGYQVSSQWMEQGVSPITTFNQEGEGQQEGGGVEQLFRHLVVPAGLIYIPGKQTESIFHHNSTTHEAIDDDIYDSLLSQVQTNSIQVNKRRKKTKRFLSKEKRNQKQTRKK